MQLFLFWDGTVNRLLCPWARRGCELPWKSSVRSINQEFLKHLLLFQQRFTKCPLCAKIFLGAGDTKILKGVKKAVDKINIKKGYRSITSL